MTSHRHHSTHTVPILKLKLTHSLIKSYYVNLNQFQHLNVTHKAAICSASQSFFNHCA